MTLRIVQEGTAEFEPLLEALSRRGESDLGRVEPAVRQVLAAVRKEGDAAVRRSVREFEKREVDALFIEDYEGHAALASLPAGVRDALAVAARRIRQYHERQLEDTTSFEYEMDGVLLG